MTEPRRFEFLRDVSIDDREGRCVARKCGDQVEEADIAAGSIEPGIRMGHIRELTDVPTPHTEHDGARDDHQESNAADGDHAPHANDSAKAKTRNAPKKPKT
jgi:hypothetical protein